MLSLHFSGTSGPGLISQIYCKAINHENGTQKIIHFYAFLSRLY